MGGYMHHKYLVPCSGALKTSNNQFSTKNQKRYFAVFMFARKLVASLLSISSVVVAAKDDPYDARAQAIVDGFTTAQVIGQMTQVDISTVMNPDDNTLNEDNVRAYAQQYVGSYLNTIWDEPLGDKYGWNATEWRGIVSRIQEITMEENGGHPIIYGLDSVHGANYVSGAVLFGQQINSGASFNPDLVHKAGRITARDTQAAGIPWVFGPILEISQNPLWSRTYETFSEDPYLVAVMGEALVRGLQSYNQTAACMKHFIGYSKTPTGHDRDNVIMADFDLLNYFLPPFKAAIEAGAMSTMENYISINGDPVIANPRILNDLLRSDLGFDGLLVSDWAEINNLKDWHRVAETYEDAVRLSLTHTSLDMNATVTATVTVTNVGTRAGKETVMLFLTQPYRTISVPEVKMLKKFKKIELQAGESQEVSFALTADDWRVYDPQIGSGFKKVTEDSNYVVAIKPDTWCNVYKNITNPLCAVFTIDTGRDNFGLPPPVANVTTSTPVIDVTGPSTTEPPAGEAGAGTVEAASY
ncbi:hypothetical protein PF008_g9605 [Phytophthora fragariae]|uniref:beta-glucosidase n=1 Tax=Phytophthora fragariae TaxID=53985 RepID=A0A6G0RW54_9STRA|nr:hypothetical protein PF008_g9605 [Phytophthora fragariae]